MINADWKWDSETGTFVIFNTADESFIGTAESRAEACEMVERLNEPQPYAPRSQEILEAMHASDMPVCHLRITKLTPEDLIGFPSKKEQTRELPRWFKAFLN